MSLYVVIIKDDVLLAMDKAFLVDVMQFEDGSCYMVRYVVPVNEWVL